MKKKKSISELKKSSGGTIIAIGGREDKDKESIILEEVAKRIGSGKLAVTAIASSDPEPLFDQYDKVFSRLGLKHIVRLDIQSRSDASEEKYARLLNDVSGVFFTGGDQLRITSQIGDTLVYKKILEIFDKGGLIAGTSAGASVVCATMLVSGEGSLSPRAGGIQMAPGLGFLNDAIIDQHFAERGRMGRLLCAIAENPQMLGIGIDEDTAIIVERNKNFSVLGSGAVYVIDGSKVSYSNIADEAHHKTISIYDVTLHVLSKGDTFELEERVPGKTKKASSQEAPPKKTVEKKKQKKKSK